MVERTRAHPPMQRHVIQQCVPRPHTPQHPHPHGTHGKHGLHGSRGKREEDTDTTKPPSVHTHGCSLPREDMQKCTHPSCGVRPLPHRAHRVWKGRGLQEFFWPLSSCQSTQKPNISLADPAPIKPAKNMWGYTTTEQKQKQKIQEYETSIKEAKKRLHELRHEMNNAKLTLKNARRELIIKALDIKKGSTVDIGSDIGTVAWIVGDKTTIVVKLNDKKYPFDTVETHPEYIHEVIKP